MFEELDTVVLTKDIKDCGLKKDDIGTVVHTYRDAFEVEFVTTEGKTVAVLTLTNKDIRKVAKKEILHVRGFASA